MAGAAGCKRTGDDFGSQHPLPWPSAEGRQRLVDGSNGGRIRRLPGDAAQVFGGQQVLGRYVKLRGSGRQCFPGSSQPAGGLRVLGDPDPGMWWAFAWYVHGRKVRFPETGGTRDGPLPVRLESLRLPAPEGRYVPDGARRRRGAQYVRARRELTDREVGQDPSRRSIEPLSDHIPSPPQFGYVSQAAS